MPNCEHCSRTVDRLIDGLCGICDITVARKAPGVIGQDYPNEVNPDKYEPAKEMELAIKKLQDHPDPRHRFSYQEAARFQKTLIRPAAQREAFEKQHADYFRQTRKVSDQMVLEGEQQIRQEVKREKEKLIKLVKEASVVGPPESHKP